MHTDFATCEEMTMREERISVRWGSLANRVEQRWSISHELLGGSMLKRWACERESIWDIKDEFSVGDNSLVWLWGWYGPRGDYHRSLAISGGSEKATTEFLIRLRVTVIVYPEIWTLIVDESVFCGWIFVFGSNKVVNGGLSGVYMCIFRNLSSLMFERSRTIWREAGRAKPARLYITWLVLVVTSEIIEG